MTEGTTRFGVSRRTLAKGAAWSVPAVAVAAAAPAYAKSGPAATLEYVGACKFPGNSCARANKGYAFAFDVTNTSQETVYLCDGADITVTQGDAILNALTHTGFGPTGCLEVAPGATGRAFFFFSGAGNSGNQNFTGTISIPWGHECPCSADEFDHPNLTATVTVTDTPPGGLCECDAYWIPANAAADSRISTGTSLQPDTSAVAVEEAETKVEEAPVAQTKKADVKVDEAPKAEEPVVEEAPAAEPTAEAITEATEG